MGVPGTAIFLSARMKSTRLPNKQMLEIKGRSITAHLIDRLKQAKRPSMIALTTSTHPQDLPLVELARKEGIEPFQGSPEDKLDRYLAAAKKWNIEFIAVVDGDDPFCDPEVIDQVIARYQAEKADYIIAPGLPVGVTCKGVRVEALREICERKSESDTEVWDAYFTQTGRFKVAHVEMEAPLRRTDVRMTLDYQEDFRFFEAIFEHLYRPGRVFSLREILELCDRHPEIPAINSSVQALYEANLARITKAPRLSAKSASPE
jgi:spore coat polysaccharide biosynthesis protein SpsF